MKQNGRRLMGNAAMVAAALAMGAAVPPPKKKVPPRPAAPAPAPAPRPAPKPRPVVKAASKAASPAQTATEKDALELYKRGFGFSLAGDEVRAKELLEQAAARGNAGAMDYLGYLYSSNHYGLKKDPQLSLSWKERALAAYRQAAAKGDADAMSALSSYYSRGELVPKDLQQARNWKEKALAAYKQAAAKGDADAMLSLGYFYQSSSGFQDYAESHRWLEQAAAKGNADAMEELASLYESDRYGLEKNPQQARYWYEKAASAFDAIAEQGDVKAISRLSSIYRFYLHDNAKARQWLEKLVDNGVTQALIDIGATYQMESNYREARSSYIRAAVAGRTDAYQELGLLASADLDDDVHARQWNEKGAAAGELLCIEWLADDLVEGDGGPQDYAGARRWYEKYLTLDLEEGGNRKSVMEKLGDLYWDGKGGPQDRAKARELYQKAAKDCSTRDETGRLEKPLAHSGLS